MNIKNKITYIAHRGYSSKYPENTKLAFEKAIEHGFKGVEFDVHITKDGELVIAHDENMDRVTLGQDKRKIKNMTLVELRQCDIRVNFKNVPFQTIMTLKEFCDAFANKFDVIDIELKTDKQEYKDIEIKTWNIIKPYVEKSKSKWIISSFNIKTCLNFLKLNTPIIVAPLYVFQFMVKDIDLTMFDELNPELSLVLNLNTKIKVKKNVKYNVWTINDKDRYKTLMKFIESNPIVSGIITNFKLWDNEFGEEQVLSPADAKLYKKGLEMEKQYLKTLCEVDKN